MFGLTQRTTRGKQDDVAIWIDKATRGLCTQARERVSDEIRAHYSDAYQTALDQGMEERQARHKALSGLGSPSKARRAFLRTYLTQRQSLLLTSLMTWNGWRQRLCLYFLYLTWLTMKVSERFEERHEGPAFIGYASLLFLAMVLLSWTCQRLLEKGRTRTVVLLAWSGYVAAVSIPLAIGYCVDANSAYLTVAWLTVIGVLSTAFEHLPLFRKLGVELDTRPSWHDGAAV